MPVLVAEIDGAVAGYAYAAPYRLRAAYRFMVEDSIYIAEAFRGLGVGTSAPSATPGGSSTAGATSSSCRRRSAAAARLRPTPKAWIAVARV
ncbi:GNAT family N-acetyltransferase [Brevundimonas diminuta]|uniref:GNAT family N-acetyltransferase n=1 Tax=Brevundimonas diminuta TaxID=293 RepID=UPI00338E6485